MFIEALRIKCAAQLWIRCNR